MSRQEAWRRLIAGEPGDAILTDVGTTTVTGVRAPGAADLFATSGFVGHPVLQTVALGDEACAALGSDLVRTGLLFCQPEIEDDEFVDPLGVRWLWAEGSPAPLEHPLESADLASVARHRRPAWPDVVQVAGPIGGDPGDRPIVIADAPSAGLLEMCFALRGNWQFLVDLTEDWRIANALLDWSLETIVAGYEQSLAELPTPPDVVLYGDDYGYQDGMFLSEVDFRTFIRPRLRTLFSRIRRLTPAPIIFHCCGAVSPILRDLADLGVEALNLQGDARGMGLKGVRADLPSSLILHGYTDLTGIGRAVERDDRRALAILVTDLVASLPAIASPVDNLATEQELRLAARGAAFVHALSPSDIHQLRRPGPVGSVIDHAKEAATATSIDVTHGIAPQAMSIPMVTLS